MPRDVVDEVEDEDAAESREDATGPEGRFDIISWACERGIATDERDGGGADDDDDDEGGDALIGGETTGAGNMENRSDITVE